MSLDVLVIAAHPDDAELGVGGLLHKLSREGRTTGILDLSRGERATRGSVEERQEEARRAAEVLGVSVRENAGLPDGGLADVPEQRLRVALLIRKHRPQILIAPMAPDRHPDHAAAHALVAAANFEAGLAHHPLEHPPYRAARLYWYYAYTEGQGVPPLVVDVSDSFEPKLEALREYRSQFYNPEYEGPETMVSSETFWEGIRIRAAYWGQRIGVKYGEPLYADLPVKWEFAELLGSDLHKDSRNGQGQQGL